LKIAFILPKLSSQGPIIVAKDLIDLLLKKNIEVDVYYFDDLVELKFNCNVKQISFRERIDFDYYDIIHSHMLRPDMYVWYHKQKSNKSFFVSTLHQNIFDNLKGNYNSIVAFISEKFWIKFLNSFDVVVTLTNSMKDVYKSKIKVDIATIYNGRSLEILEDGQIENEDLLKIKKLKENYFILGSHCLLTPRKGLQQSIKSLVQLPNYAFVVIGEGQELKNLINLSNKLGVFARCLFIGYKLNATSYLKYFDIYVMSSYSEGFPLGLLEAGLSKLPIVCSDLPIFRELFSENEVSYFELDNTNSLSKAILSCVNKKEEYANSIFSCISNKYSNNAMVKNYHDLYLLGKSNKVNDFNQKGCY
jgi:glycosyltransferase involved in cell wall biosynthesis